MPMGIVSDSDFAKEIARNQTTVKQPEIINLPTKGRGSNPEVPDSLRKIIGETSITDGRQEAIDLAASFGISPSSVSAYSQGATSTATYADRPNQSHIDESKLKIARRARNKLMLAIGGITKDKLDVTKARDLAGIAKDMSAVIRNMEPEKPQTTNNNSGPTFVVYAPQFRKEEHFETVIA